MTVCDYSGNGSTHNKINFLKFHEDKLTKQQKLLPIYNAEIKNVSQKKEEKTAIDIEEAPVKPKRTSKKNKVKDDTKDCEAKADNEIVKVIHGMFKAEVMKRDNDESQAIDEKPEEQKFNITVIQRKQTVDFYYNFKYLTHLHHEVKDIKLSFRDLYLRLKAPDNRLDFLQQLKDWKRDENPLLYAWVPKDVKQRYPEFQILPDKELENISAAVAAT